VLDIGCGNGAWLDVLRAAGCEVAGVEPDPKAAEIARSHGIEVRARISDWIADARSFDHLTLHHVIEHVHEPMELLRCCRLLLRPGGSLFIDTPNIDSEGHHLYGCDWRGLEPPRHLILFTRDALARAVSDAGFEHVRFHPNPGAFPFTSLQSRKLAAGLDPYAAVGEARLGSAPTLRQRLRARAGHRSEFITLTAARAED
jgi:SAM-dependent methyltransferase